MFHIIPHCVKFRVLISILTPTYEENEIIDLLKYAQEQGITCFDTALVYGPAEKYLGEILCESDIVLLHNWNDNIELIDWLLDIKNQGLIKRIGISIPNGYSKQLSPLVLSSIDVIEVPYNEEDKNILDYIDLRSLLDCKG